MLAREGFFYVGGKPTVVNGRTYMAGQMYVDFRIPAKQTHPYPIIMVHGGTRSGTNIPARPTAARAGRSISCAGATPSTSSISPGAGDPAILPEVYGPCKVADGDGGQRRYLSQEKYKLWPQAHLHTQWPGSGAPDDPVTLQMTSGYVPEIEDFTKQQFLNRDALVALFDKIGPAILMVHSQAGAFTWPVADARPDLVKAIVGGRAERAAVLPGRVHRRAGLVQAGADGAAVWPQRGPAHLFARGEGRHPSCRSSAGGQGRRARSGEMLAAEGAGAASLPNLRRCRSWC